MRHPRPSSVFRLKTLPSLRLSVRLLLALSAFLLAVSCAERDRVTLPDSPAGNWSVGTPVDYILDATTPLTVPDTLTGYSFYLPDGGQGTLSVARIEDGPSSPYGGGGFWISWNGTKPVQIDLDDTSSDYDMLLAYMDPPGSFSNSECEGERWICLAPLAQVDNKIRFELPLPLLANPDLPRVADGASHFRRASVISTQEQGQLLSRAHTANTFVATWLDSLPASMQASARARVTALPPSFYADDNYYIGFSRYFWGIRTTPMLGLQATATDATVAHEIGHYMSHMILGDAAYRPLEDAAPQNHGVGDVHPGRQSMTEEWAHASEWFLTGGLGIADPVEPGQLFYEMNPKAADYPSREGYATVLLARLHSHNPTVRDLTDLSRRLPVPVIGASYTDLLGLLCQGPTDMNQLRDHVAAYLAGRGQLDALPVLLERSGWRYMGTGRLVDLTGDPIKGATVRKLVKVAGVEYYPTTELTITDDDGRLGYTHLFPGSSTLRVYHEGDSVDVPIHVDPTGSTKDDVDLGTLTADFSNLLSSLQATTRVSMAVRGEHETNWGTMYEGSDTFLPFMSQNAWTGTSFSAIANSEGNTYSDERRTSGTVSPDGRTIETLTYTQTFRSAQPPPTTNGILREDVDILIRISDLPYTPNQGGYLKYFVEGPETAGHVVLAYRRLVEYEDPEIGTVVTEYTGTNWDSAERSPSVNVYFQP